jgi:aminopeptidase N
MMENKYTRSAGFTPYDWLGYGADVNHFQAGGGLGLRGYAGYVAPELDRNGDVVLTYRGNSGAAFNTELDIDGLLRIRPKATRDWLHLDAYLFGDVGTMGYRETTEAGTVRLVLAPPRADAGAGVALTIKKFWRLVDINPLTIRFDAPLILSNLPYGENDHFAFRYVVGINRSF